MTTQAHYDELAVKIRSSNFEARREACMALARDGTDSRALDLALEARSSSNSQVRYYAKRAVETICRRLDLDPAEYESQPQEDTETLCRDLMSALDSGDPLAVSVSVKLLSNPSFRNSRREAVKALSKYLIDGESCPLFGLALKILVKFGGPRILNQVTPHLSSKNARIRADSVEALGLVQEDFISDAIRTLLDDPDPRTRANAALVLHRFDSESSEKVIQAMLSSDSTSLRSSGLWAISRIPSTRSDSVLVDFFKAESEQPLFVKALKLLAKLPPSRIRELASPLRKGAADNSEKSKYVEVLLRKKLDAFSLESLSDNAATAGDLTTNEKKSGGPGPNDIIAGSMTGADSKFDENGKPASDGASSLEGLRPEGLIRGLLFTDETEEELFSIADIDPEIAGGRSKDHFDELIDRLTRQLKDPDKARRNSAAKYFAGIKSEEAIPALEKALKDPDNVVRAHARRALSAIAEKYRPGFIAGLKSSPATKWITVGIGMSALLLSTLFLFSSPDESKNPFPQSQAQGGTISSLKAGMDVAGKKIFDRGKVTRIFANAGKVILNSGGRPVELSVSPEVISVITEGDTVDFEGTITGIMPSGVVMAMCDSLKPSK